MQKPHWLLLCFLALSVGALVSCMKVNRDYGNQTETWETFGLEPQNLQFGPTTSSPTPTTAPSSLTKHTNMPAAGVGFRTPAQISQAMSQLDFLPWVGVALILIGSMMGWIKVYFPMIPADGWMLAAVGLVFIILPSLIETWWFKVLATAIMAFLVWRTYQNHLNLQAAKASSLPSPPSSSATT